MDAVLRRRAASAALHERHGEAPILADARGRMLSGELGGAVAAALDAARRLDLGPGDALLVADPYRSGGATQRLNDWLLVLPAFHDDELIGHAAMLGQVDAAHAGAVTSIRDEGLRISPVKLATRGEVNASVLELVAGNGREPAAARADLLALLAAARVGERRLAELARRFGNARLREGSDALLARSARLVAAAIARQVPAEPRSFHDHVDADGLGNGPFRLRLTLWREGERALFDWTGTAAQAAGPVNCLVGDGLMKTMVARALLGPAAASIAGNDGYADLIEVKLPAGTLLRPVEPAPLGGGRHALARIQEVLAGALSRGAPETAPAGGYGGNARFEFAGLDAEGKPFHLVDPVFGGLPGGPAGDGADGHAWWPRQDAAAAEEMESAWPVLVERLAVLADSGGAGRHRGGNAVEKVYRLLADGVVTIHDDRADSAPWGNAGGAAGARSEKFHVGKDGGRRALSAETARLPAKAGDRIVFRTAAGGGWGDPLERSSDAVRADVARRLLSAGAARERYGVVVSATGVLDRPATDALREDMRRGRPAGRAVDHGQPREGAGDAGNNG
jgi:N-methylhydantoinase B